MTPVSRVPHGVMVNVWLPGHTVALLESEEILPTTRKSLHRRYLDILDLTQRKLAVGLL